MLSLTKVLLPSVRLTTNIVEKNFPKILTWAAVGSSVAASVGTGIATWNAKDIIEEHNEHMAYLKAKLDEMYEDENCSVDDIIAMENEIKRQKMLTAAEIACEYAVPAMLLGGSVAAGISSSEIFSKRIAAVAASYAALSASYSSYRQRVANELGAEKEDELFKGIKEKEITYIDENGKEVTKKVKSYEDVPLGCFCVFFICGQNKYSQDDPVRDLAFIESVEDQITRDINSGNPANYIFGDQAFAAVGIDVTDVPLGGETAKTTSKLWHIIGKIKSQDRINAECERLTRLVETGEWREIVEQMRLDNPMDITPVETDEAIWEQYCEKQVYNANRFSFGISEEQKQEFINGNTDGLLLLCPNFDGDIFTNNAFMTLRDADVTVDPNYFGLREYE